jgi:hypothetical protein
VVESGIRLEHNRGMTDVLSASRSYPLAVIMQRTALTNRWVGEQWEVKGIVRDSSPEAAEPRVIVQSAGCTQFLYPGHRLELTRDEVEGYYLNITSPEPKVFVLWRWIDETAKPQRLTVSYGEGTRWADSGEQVDGVQVPPELLGWMAAFVDANYRPEAPKPRRYASSRDKGRMGRQE